MAGTRFDNLQRSTFTAVRNLFGYQATWAPAVGGVAITGQVLYQSPDDIEKLAGQAGYSTPQHRMEYFEDTFPGLRASVDAAILERVAIDGVVYIVRHITQEFDGKTLYATLNPEDDE